MGKFKKTLTDPKLLIVLLLGFSSGLPFLLVGATLKAWMSRADVDIKVIGLFAIVKMPYTWKFVWSPIIDRYRIAPFGRRRGWMVISQLGIMAALLAFTQLDPVTQLPMLAVVALITSFFSASQDIVIDAYRREILPVEELGLGSSLAVLGYRFGTMTASAGAFALAGWMSWQMIYAVMAGLMGVGLITALIAPEPKLDTPAPRTLKESVVGPLQEFFRRDGAWVILAFVFLYKVGESMASEMYNPFFIQLGFTNVEIAAVSKLFGVWAMIGGGLVGGLIMIRLNAYRCLWLFGILQSMALLLFSLLAQIGHSVPMLSLSIGLEYFTSGMATSAFVAFMAAQSDKRFTAVQYALLSSLGIGLPTVLLGSTAGLLVAYLGWTWYFLACSAFTIPGLLILFKVKRLLPLNPT